MRNPFKGMSADELNRGVSYLLGSSYKTELTPDELKVAILIQYLSPHGEAGFLTCPWMSKGCSSTCLDKTGRMVMNMGPRMARTTLFMEHREEYIERLFDELTAHKTHCLLRNMIPAVRLNGTSDIAWEIEHPELFEAYHTIKFYDYTKSIDRMRNYLSGDWPHNYYLCLSRKEDEHWPEYRKILEDGGTVAIVFKDRLPKVWRGFPVLDGDAHDWRVDDPPGWIVGLKAKGPAKQDTTGFVVD